MVHIHTAVVVEGEVWLTSADRRFSLQEEKYVYIGKLYCNYIDIDLALVQYSPAGRYLHAKFEISIRTFSSWMV